MDNYRTQQSEVQKIFSKTNKNMAKNEYTAEDATVMIFDDMGGGSGTCQTNILARAVSEFVRLYV